MLKTEVEVIAEYTAGKEKKKHTLGFPTVPREGEIIILDEVDDVRLLINKVHYVLSQNTNNVAKIILHCSKI